MGEWFLDVRLRAGDIACGIVVDMQVVRRRRGQRKVRRTDRGVRLRHAFDSLCDDLPDVLVTKPFEDEHTMHEGLNPLDGAHVHFAYRQRLSSALVKRKDGFSVVAPISCWRDECQVNT